MPSSRSSFLKISVLFTAGVFILNQAYSQEFEDLHPMKFEAEGYHIACYYYDSNFGEDSKNPFLMFPSTNIISLGVRTNYYWAINSDSFLASTTKLTGKIQDGFFLEENFSYEDIENRCNYAISRGTVLTPTKSSFKLYEFKASTSSLNGYEYPIRFLKTEKNNTQIKQIVLFGDSLSDPGNLKRWTKILPYFPFWNGRFSDGLVWEEYLTDRTHLPILNFAYGGAKTEGTNDAFINGLPSSYITAARNLFTGSSKDYINSYLKSYLTSDSYQSINQIISNPKQTLFVIWVGANDYLEKFENKQPADRFFENPDAVGGAHFVYKRAIDNIIDQIITLNKKGAYHFMIFNLPDIGRTPAILTSVYQKYSDDFKNKDEFSRKLTEVINKHNFYLNTSLKMIKEKLDKNININTIDIADNFDKFMNNKNINDNSEYDYGFSNMDTIYPIPGSKEKYFQNFCYNDGLFNAAFTEIGPETIKHANRNNRCVDANGKRNKLAIFWNSPHPTTFAHCWISYAFEKQMNDSGLISSNFMDIKSIKNYCMNKLN